jgi:hypothetical protein
VRCSTNRAGFQTAVPEENYCCLFRPTTREIFALDGFWSSMHLSRKCKLGIRVNRNRPGTKLVVLILPMPFGTGAVGSVFRANVLRAGQVWLYLQAISTHAIDADVPRIVFAETPFLSHLQPTVAPCPPTPAIEPGSAMRRIELLGLNMGFSVRRDGEDLFVVGELPPCPLEIAQAVAGGNDIVLELNYEIRKLESMLQAFEYVACAAKNGVVERDMFIWMRKLLGKLHNLLLTWLDVQQDEVLGHTVTAQQRIEYSRRVARTSEQRNGDDFFHFPEDAFLGSPRTRPLDDYSHCVELAWPVDSFSGGLGTPQPPNRALRLYSHRQLRRRYRNPRAHAVPEPIVTDNVRVREQPTSP